MPHPPATGKAILRSWALCLGLFITAILSPQVALADALPLILTDDPTFATEATESPSFEHTLLASDEAAPEGARQAAKAAPAITLERIHHELEQHVAQVHDVRATVSFTQISARDGSKSEGELQLAAIFPDLVRATWTKPEIYAGVFYILDAQANVYIEYVPATGEAHRLPLDQVLADLPLVQLNPDQIFSLPPADQFQLDLESVTEDDGVPYAVVIATENSTGQAYRVWVDTDRWLVTRMQMLSPTGSVQAIAEVLDLHINQGVDAAALRLLPPGTIQRTYP